MRLEKALLINFTIFLLSLLIISTSFSQVKKGEIIPFTGTIKIISYNFIVVNEINIAISSETRIYDEKGNTLKLHDLKSGLYVAVDTIRNLDGFLAKKIVVKKLKGV